MVNVGNLLLEAGEVDAAVARYRRRSSLDPDYPEAHHNLGVAYKRQVGRRVMPFAHCAMRRGWRPVGAKKK